MIPVIIPCSSTFSTSCLSLSSSSDNNNEDGIIGSSNRNSNASATATTRITTTVRRNSDHDNNNESTNKNMNGVARYYPTEKILPDKEIAYVNPNNINHNAEVANNNNCTKRNRNNLSVIHLFASYNPETEIEEFIPTTPSPSFTAIIDSTESAPKSISVPVRGVDFDNNSNINDSINTTNSHLVVCRTVDEKPDADGREEGARYFFSTSSTTTTTTITPGLQEQEQKPLMVTNCSYGFDGDDYHADNQDHEKLFSTYSSGSSSSSGSFTDGEMDDDNDDDDHDGDESKYRHPDGIGGVTLLKKITFQDDPKDLLLLTSDSEEEICEHKSLIEMTTTRDIINQNGLREDKYATVEEEFDSFLEENYADSSSPDNKSESPFQPDNLREQRTFAQSQQGVPQVELKKKAASVLDLINSEISDLHMRELELKKIHSPTPPLTQKSDKRSQDIADREEYSGGEGSSGEDDFSDSAIEYDGFTTNGSHSSGQISPSDNLNDMTNDHQQMDPEQDSEVATEINAEDKNAPANDNNERDEVDNQLTQQRPKVRPLMEEEDRSIRFTVPDETPIEREIRLTREREEEFRRLNSTKQPGSVSAPKTASLPPMMTKTKSFSSSPAKPDLGSLPYSGVGGSHKEKDAQYELATARFKREIEESMQREKELLLESRRHRTLSTESEDHNNTVTSADTTSKEESPSPEEEKLSEIPESSSLLESSPEPQEQKRPVGPENVLRKPTIVKLPINKLPAARLFSPAGYNSNRPSRFTPVVSPIRGGGSLVTSSHSTSTVGGSLPVGINKASLTPLEKKIFQSSYNFVSNKPTSPAQTSGEEAFNLPTEAPPEKKLPELPIPEDPLRIIQKPANENEEDEEEKEAEEKPKRRYIPAQDKINKEIQELVMREKELNKVRAKWKSTLDLPEAAKQLEAEQGEAETSKSTLSLQGPSAISATAAAVASDFDNEKFISQNNDIDFKRVAEDVREVTRIRAPARRRHSLLINQWEERIRQQQQLNNKK